LVRTSTVTISATGDAVITTIILDDEGRWVRNNSDFEYDSREVTLPAEDLMELRRLIASREFQTMPRQFRSMWTDGNGIRISRNSAP